jgi:hypothetical protein
MHRPNRFHLSTFVLRSFLVGLDFGFFSHIVDAVPHLLSPSLPPALVVILASPPFSSLPSLPPSALPARVCTQVCTPMTLLQLPIVIHHHPTHKSLPPAPYSLVLYVLPISEQRMEKQQMLNFMLYMIKVANTFNLSGFLSFLFVFSFFWCLELQTVVKVYSKDKTKAKQREGLCE